MTKEQAIEISETEWWVGKSDQVIADFQLTTELLCMPFAIFHAAVEKRLSRSVFSHEFADPVKIKNELYQGKSTPDLAEILEKIPEVNQILNKK